MYIKYKIYLMLLLVFVISNLQAEEMTGWEKIIWGMHLAQTSTALLEQNYNKALPLAEEHYQISIKKLPIKSKYVLTSVKLLITALNYKALASNQNGQYPEALKLVQRAYLLSKKHLKNKYLHIHGLTFGNLATLYAISGDYHTAEILYQQTKSYFIKQQNQQNQQNQQELYQLFTTLVNLSGLSEVFGHYGEAVNYINYAEKISKKIKNFTRDSYLDFLLKKAGIYNSQGRKAEARAIYFEAQELLDALQDPDYIPLNSLERANLDYASNISNNDLILKAIEINRALFGLSKEGEEKLKWINKAKEYAKTLKAKHPYNLLIQVDIAVLLAASSEPQKAIQYLEDNLNLVKQVFGEKHTKTLFLEKGIAYNYMLLKQYDKAEKLYINIIKNEEEILSVFNPSTINSMMFYAQLHIYLGNTKQFIRLLKKIERALFFHANDQFFTTPQSEIRRFFFNKASKSLQNIVFTALKKLNDTPEHSLRYYAAGMMSRWKKHQLEQEAIALQIAKNSPEKKALLLAIEKDHNAITRLFTLMDEKSLLTNGLLTQAQKIVQMEKKLLDLSKNGRFYKNYKSSLFKYKKSIMEKQIKLEKKLPNYLSDIEKDLTSFSKIRQHIPDNTIFLDIKMYSELSLTKKTSDSLSWMLLLADKDKTFIMKPLGSIEPAKILHKTMQQMHNDWKMIWDTLKEESNKQEKAKLEEKLKLLSKKMDVKSQQLYQTLFGSIDKILEDYTHKTIYIAPDSFLNQIPFNSLRLPDGRYWIERQTLVQLQSGRDLLKPTISNNNHRIVAFGNVKYKLKPIFKETEQLENSILVPKSFSLLTHTKNEIKAIQDAYANKKQDADININYKIETFLKEQATEQNLKQALEKPANIVHFATHAFFTNGNKVLQQKSPLLFSGIALAGASHARRGGKDKHGDDGILFAQEILELNLSKTKLVVLSACDTALGVEDYSEGIYGLIRAFNIAGAQSLIMTLWQLDDKYATAFMERFYQKWTKELSISPAEHLRQVQLDFIYNKVSKKIGEEIDEKIENFPYQSDPNIWAAYTFTGRY